MGEPHNSTRPSGAPKRSISNIPIYHAGVVIGYGEMKDDIVTIELTDTLHAQYIIEGITFGLVQGLTLSPVNIPVFPHPNQTRMEI
jgi:hypothetical protein